MSIIYPSTKTKWTILFIVHAVVEDTRVYAEKLFAELLQANVDPDKVQVFVLHDTYEYDNTDQVHAILYEIKRNKTKGATLKDVLKQPVLESNTNTNTPYVDTKKTSEQSPAPSITENVTYSNITDIHDLGPIPITDEKGLEKVFDEVEKLINSAENGSEDTNPDRKRIIITWDHSNGFGFFDNSQSDSSIQIIKSSRRPDMLMVNELEKALKNYLDKKVKIPDKKIEILIMMHCWMQNIEAGYQLRDVVEILIGAETVFDFQGYDFKKLINRISADFKETNEELAKQILEDAANKLNEIQDRPSVPSGKIFLSATKPLYSVQIREQIGLLAKELRTTLIEPRERLRKILEARAGCFELTKVADGYTPWYFVDIFQAIKKLESKDLTPQVKQISKEIEKVLDEYIIETISVSGEKKLPPDFKGVSVCFPYQNDTFTIGTIYKDYYEYNPDDFNDSKKIDFANDSEWPRFLYDLLNEVKKEVKSKMDLNKKDIKKEIERRKKELTPTETEITQIVEKILSPVVNWQNFTLDLTINFDIIESQFLVNSVVANCIAVNESNELTIFKTNPGNPKRGAPGGGKTGVPGSGKTGVPGGGKTGVPGGGKTGVPGELLPPTMDAYGEDFNKKKRELFEDRGYFAETENGTEEKKQ